MRALVTDYMRSERYRRLSPQTRALYEIGYTKLFAFPLRVDGALTALGDLYADEVTRGVVRLFLDGYPSPKAANRYRAALSAAYAWASEPERGAWREHRRTVPSPGRLRMKALFLTYT